MGPFEMAQLIKYITSKAITPKLGHLKIANHEIDYLENRSLPKIAPFEIRHFENDTFQNRSLRNKFT